MGGVAWGQRGVGWHYKLDKRESVRPTQFSASTGSATIGSSRSSECRGTPCSHSHEVTVQGHNYRKRNRRKHGSMEIGHVTFVRARARARVCVLL